jgi:predicted signal transduction protein with EAL and GGDEF domain
MSVIRFKAPKTCHVVPNGPLVQYADYLMIEKENAQLKSEVEELKAQLVDAVGDGFYDGYLACAEHAKAFSFDSYDINDSYVLQLSEQHESEHHYAKSIADIRAYAVMSFANMTKQAYISNFVPGDLTVYDVYQSARNHVKDNYQVDTDPWTGIEADKAKGDAA